MMAKLMTRGLGLAVAAGICVTLAGCEPWHSINNNTDQDIEIGYSSQLTRCREIDGKLPPQTNTVVRCKLTALSEIRYRSPDRQCRAGPQSIGKAVTSRPWLFYTVQSLNITDLTCDKGNSVPPLPSSESPSTP